MPTVATHGELAVPASVCRLALLADPDLRHVRTLRWSVDVDPHDEDRATSGWGLHGQHASLDTGQPEGGLTLGGVATRGSRRP
jgi:hypothetical protein